MTRGEPKKTRKLPNLYAFMQTGSNSEGDGPISKVGPMVFRVVNIPYILNIVQLVKTC